MNCADTAGLLAGVRYVIFLSKLTCVCDQNNSYPSSTCMHHITLDRSFIVYGYGNHTLVQTQLHCWQTCRS